MGDATMTDRLKRCLDAGSLMDLFPLLSDWPLDELKELIKDVEKFHEETIRNLESGYKKESLLPQNFFSQERPRALDGFFKPASEHVEIVCSEIISVALFYKELRERDQPKAR